MSNGKDFTVHILGWDSAMPTQGNISSSQVIKYGKNDDGQVPRKAVGVCI